MRRKRTTRSRRKFRRTNGTVTADIAVAIDDVIEKKLAAVEALHSQFFEGGANGHAGLVPDMNDAEKVAARKKAVPFGVFLALGGIVGVLVGPELVDFYDTHFLD